MIDLTGGSFEWKVSILELQGKVNSLQYKYTFEIFFFDSSQQKWNAYYILFWAIYIH